MVVREATVEVRSDKEIVLRDGFHDESDALEWLTKNRSTGDYTIVTTRRIRL